MARIPGEGNISDPFAGSRPQGDGLARAAAIIQQAISGASGGTTSGGTTSGGSTSSSSSSSGSSSSGPGNCGPDEEWDPVAKKCRKKKAAGQSGGSSNQELTSDQIYGRMTPEEKKIAEDNFNKLMKGEITQSEYDRVARRNERRVRQEIAAENAPPEEQLPTDQATQALLEWQKAQAEQAKQQAKESANAVIQNLLNDYGLGELGDTVWKWIQAGDTEPASLIQKIRQSDPYKQRFKGMKMRQEAGMNAISEKEYIDLENTYRRTIRAAGIPPDLFDQPEEISKLIGYDVSPNELAARINDGYQQVAQSNQAVIQQMKRLYDVSEGELAAYFLDPERTLPMLSKRARAAQIAGQGALQAGMELTAGQAEQLATQGISQQEAQQGFQTIAGAQELFGGLAGTTEQAIGAEEQVAGIFGTSAAAQQRIRQRTRERQAIFEQGGRFATGQGGTVTGLQ